MEIAALKKELARAKARITEMAHESIAQAQAFRDEIRRRAAKPKAKKPPLPPDEERDRIIKGLKTRLRNCVSELHTLREWAKSKAGTAMPLPFELRSGLLKILHPETKLSDITDAYRVATYKRLTAWESEQDTERNKARRTARPR